MPMNFGTAPPNTSGPPTGDDVDLVSTHQRLLIAAALRTKGTILELGCGWYSTPLLHEIAKAQDRKLITLDNQEPWLNQFKDFKCDNHRLLQVGWWGDVWNHVYDWIPSGRVGLCFADHGQPIEREYAIRALHPVVDVWVLHDTEEGLAYGYKRTLNMFKYTWTDESQKAHTTLASMTVNFDDWGLITLPERGLTEDVT